MLLLMLHAMLLEPLLLPKPSNQTPIPNQIPIHPTMHRVPILLFLSSFLFKRTQMSLKMLLKRTIDPSIDVSQMSQMSMKYLIIFFFVEQQELFLFSLLSFFKETRDAIGDQIHKT
jgi:hypothetical protein